MSVASVLRIGSRCSSNSTKATLHAASASLGLPRSFSVLGTKRVGSNLTQLGSSLKGTCNMSGSPLNAYPELQIEKSFDRLTFFFIIFPWNYDSNRLRSSCWMRTLCLQPKGETLIFAAPPFPHRLIVVNLSHSPLTLLSHFAHFHDHLRGISMLQVLFASGLDSGHRLPLPGY